MLDEPQVLSEGLADLAAGAELAAAVASVDRARLAPADVFAVMTAHQRLVAHYQGQLLADLYEAGRLSYADGDTPLSRRRDLDRFSGDEASFTLHWPVELTQSWQHLAEHLMLRLPAVYDLVVAGRLDLDKARAFHLALLPVRDEFVGTILDRTLDKAPGWTVDNLYRRLRYWIHKLDPACAEDSNAGQYSYEQIRRVVPADQRGQDRPG